MAQMIPDSMPPGKSIGEQILFSRLQSLPDDCIVCYEPAIARRYPDFVVFMPDRGLLIIEAKGWRAPQIVGGDSRTIRVRTNAAEGTVEQTNPIRQARDYMYGLMDVCRGKPAAACLLNQDGKHKGKFRFPFGSLVVLTQISREELRNHPAGDLTAVLPEDQLVDCQEAMDWNAFTGAQLKERLSSFFSPRWHFPPLTCEQISALRTILDPVLLVPPTPAEMVKVGAMARQVALLGDEQRTVVDTLKALDLDQERYARSLAAGHRLLFGVAGSGKTVVVVSRARYLSEALPSGAILVLCFNVAFRTYLKAVLHGLRNVDVYSFHGWAHHNGVERQEDETPAQFGARLLEVLEAGRGDAGRFDAVLIDEAQDFDPSWFACAKAAMKEPMTGDLLIVGDRNQTSYERAAVSWKSLGINAVGRTRILRRNYRNSRPVLEAAAPFAENSESDDGIAGVVSDPKESGLDSTVRPVLLKCSNRDNEMAAVVRVVRGLLSGTLEGQSFAPLEPSEIGLLYRERDACLPHLLEQLSHLAPVVWLSEKIDARDSRQRILEPGVKLQTIHAAKGLEYRAVILVCADQIGARSGDIEREKRLLYVALTRAKEVLTVTCTVGPGRQPSALLAALLESPVLLQR